MAENKVVLVKDFLKTEKGKRFTSAEEKEKEKEKAKKKPAIGGQ